MSRIKDNKMSQNHIPKSHYCKEELTKTNFGQRLRQCTSNTSFLRNNNQSCKTDHATCDVAFLKKLLAMNKKEELVLNKKLASVMRNEELQKSLIKDDPSSSSTLLSFDSNLNEKRVHGISQSLVPEVPHQIFKTPIDYDMNGRRIYYYSDIEEDHEEDEVETLPFDYASEKSNTWVNTLITYIKTRSGESGDTKGRSRVCSKHKSLTVVNQPIQMVTMQMERELGYKEENLNDGSLQKPYFKKDIVLSHSPQGADNGNCTQYVVADSFEVAKNLATKKVFKVWDYRNRVKTDNNIQRTKAEDSVTEGAQSSMKSHSSHQENEKIKLIYNKIDTESIEKEGRNCELKSAKTQIFRRRIKSAN